MVNTYFTSDFHFGHENIIKYCNRPFKNLKEMEETIINNWNSIVKPEDNVYFLGDFCFTNSKGGKKGEGVVGNPYDWIDRLNGNIIFIKGNHDNTNGLNVKLECGVIKHGGYRIFLVHNPDHYDKDYKINLVGHVHEKWKIKKVNGNYLINVGVDVWNFKPIDWEQINKELQRFKKNEC